MSSLLLMRHDEHVHATYRSDGQLVQLNDGSGREVFLPLPGTANFPSVDVAGSTVDLELTLTFGPIGVVVSSLTITTSEEDEVTGTLLRAVRVGEWAQKAVELGVIVKGGVQLTASGEVRPTGSAKLTTSADSPATMYGTPASSSSTAQAGDPEGTTLFPVPHEIRRRLRVQGPTDETLEWVARIYNEARLRRRPPARQVEIDLDVPRTTASKWVRRAREKGLVPPPDALTKARALGLLTDQSPDQ